MVPSTRLILWTSLIVLPFATLAGAAEAVRIPSIAAIGAFLLVAIGDAIMGSRLLNGVRVRYPELVRFQKDLPGEIELMLQNKTGGGRTLRLALPFPKGFEVDDETRRVLLPAGVTDSRLAWRCTPEKRGKYTMTEIFLETNSPLGFWVFRARQASGCELRVYPNLREERRRVAALFLRRGRSGAHAQRTAGTGREFEKLRQYSPGDNLGDIHWKASARSQTLISKMYQVERTHEVYVVVDVSRLAARPLDFTDVATGLPGIAIEKFVSAALLLGLAAEQQGDQFGLITFSDRVHSFIRARSGAAHLDTCREQLYALQPRDVAPDFEELFTLIRLRLRKRALLIVLTALDDPILAEGFVKATELTARQHLVMANVLQPPGVEPLFSKPAETVDNVYRALSGHLQWQKLRELQLSLRRRGIRLAIIDPENLTNAILSQHSEARARQLV